MTVCYKTNIFHLKWKPKYIYLTPNNTTDKSHKRRPRAVSEAASFRLNNEDFLRGFLLLQNNSLKIILTYLFKTGLNIKVYQ